MWQILQRTAFCWGLLFLLPVLPQCSSHLIFNDPNQCPPLLQWKGQTEKDSICPAQCHISQLSTGPHTQQELHSCLLNISTSLNIFITILKIGFDTHCVISYPSFSCLCSFPLLHTCLFWYFCLDHSPHFSLCGPSRATLVICFYHRK